MRHAVEVRHRVGRRDFHRDCLAGDQRAQLAMELGPRRVGPHLAGESLERRKLYAVDELFQHHSCHRRHVELSCLRERHPHQFDEFGIRTNDAVDAVGDRDGLAGPGQQDKEPARPHAVDAEHACRRGIDAVKVVEQPAVGAKRAEQLPQRSKIEVFEETHWCRGSGPAARHSHPGPPRARQVTWSIAPS